jgi:sulfatase maturation enzyme AslB (radical SAM superfamily)
MPYCKALYNHLFVDVRGYFAPCCFYKEKQKIHNSEMSWIDFYNSDYLNNIRNNMSTGWDQGCLNCKSLEEQKLESYRNVVDIYCKSEIPKIEYIEISCNNSCNIRCRMCGPEFSSKWANTLGVENLKIKNFKNFLESINTKDLQIVKYLGGEPFVTPEIKILFEWMDSLPQKIKFYCNTNLTMFPEKYVKYLSSFNTCIIGYSIDGIGLVNDYIRQDSDWETVYSNFLKWENFKKEANIYSYIHTTVQAYNFHDLLNIKKLADKFNLHHSAFKIFNPEEFTLNSLPIQHINKYSNNYNKKFITDYEFQNELFVKLKSRTKSQDKLLKTNIEKYVPEISEWI